MIDFLQQLIQRWQRTVFVRKLW